MSQQEFEAILTDPSKLIVGSIIWRADEDHWPALEFRAPVLSEPRWPLTVMGSWNPKLEKLTYLLRHAAVGRIIGLDLGGPPHVNPSREVLRDTHKHRWTERFRDKEAYVPNDITASWDKPLTVWMQFLEEVEIMHSGGMREPVRGRELGL